MMQRQSLYFLVFLWIGSTASAQAYLQGYSRYQRGNIKGAIAALESAITQAKNESDLVNIYKYLGISFYSDGQKEKAAESFKKALRIDPKIEINPDEVLDPAVIEFVNGIRSTMTTKATEKESENPQNATHETATDSINSTEKKTVPPSKKSITSRIRIKTNAPQAKIIADGQTLGSAGETIVYKIGMTTFTIEAPGYKSRKFHIDLKKDQETRLMVPLQELNSDQDPGPIRRSVSVAGVKNKRSGDELFLEPDRNTRKRMVKNRENADLSTDMENYSGFWTTDKMSPQSPENRASSLTSGDASTSQTKWSPAWALIPFGFGQFLNGRPILGTGFMTVEFAILYHSLQLQNQASKSKKEANKTASSGKVSAADQELINQKNSESDRGVKQATLSQIAFMMVWIAGSAQAAVDMEGVKIGGSTEIPLLGINGDIVLLSNTYTPSLPLFAARLSHNF